MQHHQQQQQYQQQQQQQQQRNRNRQLGTTRDGFLVKWLGVFFMACLFMYASTFSRFIGTVKNSSVDIFDLPYSSSPSLPPLHISFGLSGNHEGFLAEFEVALKSVLLNAPLERPMHIHLLADIDAYNSLESIFNKTEITNWRTRNQIEIHCYYLTPDLPSLRSQIEETFRVSFPDFKLWVATGTHTLGTFFRLIAHQVVPPSVVHLVYMDVDVVIISNLEGLMTQIQSNNALFHWGKGMCAGFIVLNVPLMDDIWALAKASPMKNISETTRQGIDDQLIFMSVNMTYPNKVNVLDSGWDMTVTLRWAPQHQPFDKVYPNTGMLHFNGGSANKGPFFGGNKTWLDMFPDTWGSAKYYIRLPWTWARYQASNLHRPRTHGYEVKINYWGVNRP